MKILDDYNEKLQAIYDYFGFAEDWTVYPIDDRREMFWRIVDDESEVEGYSLAFCPNT